MDKVRVGWIGMGARGEFLLKMVLEHLPDVEVLGVCDLYEDRTEKGRAMVEAATGKSPVAVTDYRKIIDIKEIDAIITPSAWEAHTDVCIDAMRAGKYAAMEVGGAYSLDQCWDIVRTYEETGVPCMMLENCCYGKEELAVLNMIKKGIFGEVVHCEGGYCHDLRREVGLGNEKRHYRLRNYKYRNGDVYPTHALGPIAKCLNINRGNRMISLTSMSSKAAGMHHWINEVKGPEDENAQHKFNMGDVVTTCIKCANGETITLTHDTTLPRPYSRRFTVQGTKGIYCEGSGIMVDGYEKEPGKHRYRDIADLYDQFLHPIWKGYEAIGGHGGMDYLSMRAFIDAVKAGTNTPIDAYDTAAWMSITPLSEQSVACGSMPVAIPDFTNGKWTHREPPVRSKYCLEEVCEVDE